MNPMELPGLERLMDVCRRSNLRLETSSPAREPLKAGNLFEGVPFDPILASVYARLGYAAFATEVKCWSLTQSTDIAHDLERINKWWREEWWQELSEAVIVFGGDTYAYATVPRLADEFGRQPVIRVDTYESEPKVMPVASNVDRFFDTYSRFLEAVVSEPDYQQTGNSDLLFPWDATDILSRDERLVEWMRAGCFDALMKNADDSTRRWAAQVMGTTG